MRKRKPLPFAESTAPTDHPELEPAETSLEPSSKIEGLRLARKFKAARYIGAGAGRERVIEALIAEDSSLSQYAARRIYYEVLNEWKTDYEQEMPYHRATQVRRLQTDLATMRAERVMKTLPPGRERPTWNDIARHERELAKITGTNAPVNVRMLDVNETMRESLAQVIGDMTPEEMKDILTEGVELEAEDFEASLRSAE